MKPFTFVFYVAGECGPDRYLLKSEATSRTDAVRRGKAFAKAEFVRFVEAIEGHDVPGSAYDALELRPFAKLMEAAR